MLYYAILAGNCSSSFPYLANWTAKPHLFGILFTAIFSPFCAKSEVRGEMWQNHQLPLSILPWTIWTYMNPLRCLPRTWVWWKSNAVCSIFSIPAFLVMRSTCPWLRTASCNRKMAIRWSKYLPFAPFLCTFHHLFRPLPWKFSKS